jgi:hypothetical protein
MTRLPCLEWPSEICFIGTNRLVSHWRLCLLYLHNSYTSCTSKLLRQTTITCLIIITSPKCLKHRQNKQWNFRMIYIKAYWMYVVQGNVNGCASVLIDAESSHLLSVITDSEREWNYWAALLRNWEVQVWSNIGHSPSTVVPAYTGRMS